MRFNLRIMLLIVWQGFACDAFNFGEVVVIIIRISLILRSFVMKFNTININLEIPLGGHH